MSNSTSTTSHSGEAIEVKLTPAQIEFIESEAKRLDQVTDPELLENFAETWWNLCQWEKQRLDILDTKAQMLLGLSGIATAIIGSGFAQQSQFFRAAAAFCFLLSMAGALFALCIRNVGGFVDGEVFGALSAATTPVGKTPPFTDKNPARCYYRETALQRWLVYDFYKKASAGKSPWIKASQVVAVLAVIFAAIGVVFPPDKPQAQSPTPTSVGTAPASTVAPAPASAPTLSPTNVSGSSPSLRTPASAVGTQPAQP